jgi:hypothetical protein
MRIQDRGSNRPRVAAASSPMTSSQSWYEGDQAPSMSEVEVLGGRLEKRERERGARACIYVWRQGAVRDPRPDSK